METILSVLPFVSPLASVVLTLVIVPYLVRLYRLHREQGLMIKKKLFEHTGVVIFGVFDGQLQSDYLGGFLTTLFGERLFDLIVEWNERPSPSIISPRSDYESAHLQEILAARASPFILQSRLIDCYFHKAEEFGTPSYKFAKFVVGLARPDATQLSCHDYPRIIMLEVGALKRIMQDADTKPQYESPDGFTWLKTVRELGEMYLSGKHHSLTILEIPLSH